MLYDQKDHLTPFPAISSFCQAKTFGLLTESELSLQYFKMKQKVPMLVSPNAQTTFKGRNSSHHVAQKCIM